MRPKPAPPAVARSASFALALSPPCPLTAHRHRLLPLARSFQIWQEAGSDRPARGVELHHPALSDALAASLELTPAQWTALGVGALPSGAFIRVGQRYVRAAATRHALSLCVLQADDSPPPSGSAQRRRSAAGGGIGGGGLHAAAPRVALRECVDLFSAQEDLGGDDAWYCPRCKTHRCGTKRLQTWSLPDVLVLQLKRFEVRGGLRRKLAGAVDCPIEGLDLSEFCLSPDPDGSLYDLQAVSNHYGSAHGGHYTACSRVGGDWYECDDQHVRRVTAESVVTPAAYVLIYARRRPNTKDAPKLTMGSDTKALTTAWL
mmetsp:Transcript_48402/g.143057  ORF Transcript_48402/g.143057 Transcript_48402/m.143057 type:complete len:317 (+) Transcript_48402:207-1157(+)